MNVERIFQKKENEDLQDFAQEIVALNDEKIKNIKII
jgi:hypothetical protein